MKFGRMAALICVAVFSTVFCVSADEIMTNERVVTLVKSGIGEDVVISKIQASECQFDTSTDEIVRLKNEGVGESIMQGMFECMNKQKGRTDELQQQNDTEYQTALELMKYGKYDEAIGILNKLATKGADIKYRFALIDALLEKVRLMKKAGNAVWESKAYEVQNMIRDIYQNDKTINDPDYWLLHAKFSGIVRKAYKAKGAIEKAFFFRPGYIKAYIVKGDIYFHLADSINEFDDKARQSYGETSKLAYKTALESNGITPEERALIYYNLGELEFKIMEDHYYAVKYWKESVAADPESAWGKLAGGRLDKYGK